MKLSFEKAVKLLERDHGGCDDTTCNLSIAMNNGYWNHALDLWVGSGAASSEFDNFKVNRKLSRQEANEMCDEVSNMECKHCQSIIWEMEWTNGYCSNCGEENERL